MALSQVPILVLNLHYRKLTYPIHNPMYSKMHCLLIDLQIQLPIILLIITESFDEGKESKESVGVHEGHTELSGEKGKGVAQFPGGRMEGGTETSPAMCIQGLTLKQP